MPVFHTATNVVPWSVRPAFRTIDAVLSHTGSLPTDVNWDSYEYENDRIHFTKDSFEVFCEDLAEMLRCYDGRWLVLTDSTVGWYDYDGGGEWTGWASVVLASTISQKTLGGKR